MTQLELVHSDLSPRTIAAALASPFRAVRSAAVDLLEQRLGEVDYAQAVQDIFAGQAIPPAHVLEALSLVPSIARTPLAPEVLRCLDSPDSAVRKGSARLLARCFPEHCRDLDASLEHFDVRYELCFSQDDETAVSLYRWYLNRGCNPDPAFGLLLTPEWIARQATEFPDTIARLARQTGYIETEAIADALPLLENGCWCIPADVSASDRIHLALRSAEIERAVHQLLASHQAPKPTAGNFETPLELAALCAAARSIDDELLRRRRHENTLKLREFDPFRSALCKHATLSYCRRILVTDGLQAAREFDIPRELLGKFLIERTSALLVHNTDLRAERTLHLKTRWHSRTRKSAASLGHWVYPIETDADDPQLKLTVLPTNAFRMARRFLEAPSPGARAVANLLAATERSDLIPAVFQLETQHAPLLLPLGIEIQTPFSSVRDHESLGWKQALRALGIPSPRRPEYRSMVEASVPPARSVSTMLILPLLLEQLGFFREPTDLALHLSFSGHIHDRIHYLVMAQQFINEPRVRPHRTTQIARLMSKGFLHLNADAIPLDGVPHAGLRTELRTFRMAVESFPDGPRLRRSFLDDMTDVSLLAAAVASDSPALRQVWDDYCRTVEADLDEVSPEFRELLKRDWWEATGEPRDEAFARELPLVRDYLRLREQVVQSGRDRELRLHFRTRRSQAAHAAAQLLGIDLEHIDSTLISPLTSRASTEKTSGA